MESLALIAMLILFFGIFGGLISIGLLKIKTKSRFKRRVRNALVFLLALFSLLMALSLALSTIAIAIRLLGAMGLGVALYALLRIFRGIGESSQN